MDGMNDTPLSYNCERRSEYIVDGPACIEAFLHCCKEMEIQRAERKHDSLILARSKKLGQGMEGKAALVTFNSHTGRKVSLSGKKKKKLFKLYFR